MRAEISKLEFENLRVKFRAVNAEEHHGEHEGSSFEFEGLILAESDGQFWLVEEGPEILTEKVVQTKLTNLLFGLGAKKEKGYVLEVVAEGVVPLKISGKRHLSPEDACGEGMGCLLGWIDDGVIESANWDISPVMGPRWVVRWKSGDIGFLFISEDWGNG